MLLLPPSHAQEVADNSIPHQDAELLHGQVAAHSTTGPALATITATVAVLNIDQILALEGLQKTCYDVSNRLIIALQKPATRLERPKSQSLELFLACFVISGAFDSP